MCLFGLDVSLIGNGGQRVSEERGKTHGHVVATFGVVSVDSFIGCAQERCQHKSLQIIIQILSLLLLYTLSTLPLLPLPHPPPRSNAPLSSTTMPSKLSLISFLTSESQFSFMLSAQLVCCKNKCSRPHFIPEIWGWRVDVMWSVIRCEPRAREGRVRGVWV